MWSEPVFWETGLLPDTDVIGPTASERSVWVARWIGLQGLVADPELPITRAWDGLLPVTHFRRVFQPGGKVDRARLYVTARGVYEASVNGARVGNHTLAPGWTDYHRRLAYQAFDVTDLIRDGENVLGAQVAPGWYAGYVAFGPQCRNYGTTPQLLMQLHLDLDDGREEVFATGEGWRASTGSRRYGDLLFGEYIDARRHPDGWDQPGFDDRGWRDAAVTAIGSVPIVASESEPVRALDELTPVAIAEQAPGVWIVDLGQNIAGRVRLQARGAAGTTIRLRHGERLNPDGSLYTANLRGPLAVDTFVLAGTGADELFEPRFTWHGFQYVEVTGYPGALTADAVTGVFVGSDTTPVGSFSCSDPLVNRLQENILWGQRSNFLSIPTDCPQRDERLGWLGDAQAFVGTAVGNMDVAAFFTKWIQDVRDAQSSTGAFPDVAPRLADLQDGAPAWGDAGVIVPWTLWRTYGDIDLIERHWASMVRWMDWLRVTNPDMRWRKGRHNDFGDWLSVGADTPKELIGTAYFAHDCRLMAEMARAIGRYDEAKLYLDLFERVAEAFRTDYVQDDGRIHGGTQTAYCLALHFGLLPAELSVRTAAHLVADLRERGWHISTGFVGVSYICHVLTDAGYPDVAYKLLLQDGYPSWKYSILHGATTVWERWDGWTEEHGFQNVDMNSFNHYTLGSVGEWMRRGILGIDTDREVPGYRSLTIAPVMDRSLDFADGWYRGITGTICTRWEWTEAGFRMEVTIPANVDARVIVPTDDPCQISESGVPVASAPGIRDVEAGADSVRLTVGSGTYRFDIVNGAV